MDMFHATSICGVLWEDGMYVLDRRDSECGGNRRVCWVRERGSGRFAGGGPEVLILDKERLAVRCGDGGLLEVLELQPASKKAMQALAFLNGMGDRTLELAM